MKDTTIIAAIIGGLFTLIGAIIGISRYSKNKISDIKNNEKTKIKITQK